MCLHLAVPVKSVLEIVYLSIVEVSFMWQCFCALLYAKNMPRMAASRCSQHTAAAWGHVEDVASLRSASAKEMAFEKVVL